MASLPPETTEKLSKTLYNYGLRTLIPRGSILGAEERYSLVLIWPATQQGFLKPGESHIIKRLQAVGLDVCMALDGDIWAITEIEPQRAGITSDSVYTAVSEMIAIGLIFEEEFIPAPEILKDIAESAQSIVANTDLEETGKEALKTAKTILAVVICLGILALIWALVSRVPKKKEVSQ